MVGLSTTAGVTAGAAAAAAVAAAVVLLALDILFGDDDAPVRVLVIEFA